MLEAAHGLLASAGRAVGDITDIVVGVGPGGFTGLRIGLATALGLGQALRVPVVGASSLEALALGIAEAAPPGAPVAPVLDVRRGELFCAAYRTGEDGSLAELLPPAARAPGDLARLLAALGDEVWLGGDGVAAGGDALDAPGLRAPAPGAAAHRISAVALARRAAAGAVLPARPVYARLPDAEVNRRAALAARGG